MGLLDWYTARMGRDRLYTYNFVIECGEIHHKLHHDFYLIMQPQIAE